MYPCTRVFTPCTRVFTSRHRVYTPGTFGVLVEIQSQVLYCIISLTSI